MPRDLEAEMQYQARLRLEAAAERLVDARSLIDEARGELVHVEGSPLLLARVVAASDDLADLVRRLAQFRSAGTFHLDAQERTVFLRQAGAD